MSIWKKAVSNKRISLVLSWLTGFLFAGIVIWWMGIGETLSALRFLQLRYLGLAIFIFLSGIILRLIKWVVVLYKQNSPYDASVIFFASKLWGSFLPARIGELAPLAVPRYRTGRIAALIVIDRLFESYSTLLAGAVGFVLLGFQDKKMIMIWIFVMVIISIIFFAAAYSNMWHRMSLIYKERRLLNYIFLTLEKISISLRELGKYWILLLTLSMIATALDFVFIQILFLGLNQSVSLPLIAVAWCASVFVALVSITPGGLGIADASYMYLYHLQGVSSESLGAFFLLNRGISMLIPVLLFFLVLGLMQLNKNQEYI